MKTNNSSLNELKTMQRLSRSGMNLLRSRTAIFKKKRIDEAKSGYNKRGEEI